MAMLYGELSDSECADIERHIEHCSICHSELIEFRNLRDSIVEWKQETLGNILTPTAAPTFSLTTSGVARQPSAVAAIREFFALSPLWMKGAVALGSVLFCLFAFLTVARLREKPTSVTMATHEQAYLPDELHATIENLAQKRVAELTSNKSQSTEILTDRTPANKQRKTSHQPSQSAAEIAHRASLKPRRPLTKTEREQLAADLRLLPSDDEVDLDLVEDRANRPN